VAKLIAAIFFIQPPLDAMGDVNHFWLTTFFFFNLHSLRLFLSSCTFIAHTAFTSSSKHTRMHCVLIIMFIYIAPHLI
jgi:hypothetical protein